MSPAWKSRLQSLGDEILRRWEGAGKRAEDFSDLAAEILARRPLVQLIEDPFDTVEWALTEEHLPAQIDLPGEFGTLSLTVYAKDGLSIQILHWLTGSTAIHRHAFTGVFGVLTGSSLEIRYRFDPILEESGFAFGELNLESALRVHPGDAHRIEAEVPHFVYHLERGTVSYVIRVADQRGEPQLVYHPPCIAHDRRAIGPLEEARRLQAVRYLLAAGDPRARSALRRIMATESWRTLWRWVLLVMEQPLLDARVPWADVALWILERDAQLGRMFLEACFEQRRRSTLSRLPLPVCGSGDLVGALSGSWERRGFLRCARALDPAAQPGAWVAERIADLPAHLQVSAEALLEILLEAPKSARKVRRGSGDAMSRVLAMSAFSPVARDP